MGRAGGGEVGGGVVVEEEGGGRGMECGGGKQCRTQYPPQCSCIYPAGHVPQILGLDGKKIQIRTGQVRSG